MASVLLLILLVTVQQVVPLAMVFAQLLIRQGIALLVGQKVMAYVQLSNHQATAAINASQLKDILKF